MTHSKQWWVAAGLLFLVASPAAAYLDPASGSMMLQLILAGAAGVAVAVRLFWGRLLSLLGVRRAAPEPDARDPEPPGGV
jgi:hypothetical protein